MRQKKEREEKQRSASYHHQMTSSTPTTKKKEDKTIRTPTTTTKMNKRPLPTNYHQKKSLKKKLEVLAKYELLKRTPGKVEKELAKEEEENQSERTEVYTENETINATLEEEELSLLARARVADDEGVRVAVLASDSRWSRCGRRRRRRKKKRILIRSRRWDSRRKERNACNQTALVTAKSSDFT